MRPFLATTCLLVLLATAATPAPAESRTIPPPQPRLVVGGQGYFPVAQLLKDGRVAVVLRGGAEHVGIKGRLDMVFSDDRGKTWSKPSVVVDSPVDDRNPAFGQAQDGALVVAFWRAAKDTYQDYDANAADKAVNTWVTRSTDGGKTWSEPAEIDVRDIGYGSPYGKILTLPDGSMLMNIYGYGVRPAGETLEAKEDHSYLYRSEDNGKTWKRFATVAKGFNETGLLRLPNGTLLAAMRSAGDKANVYLTRSSDGGKTWAEPEQVTQPATHPADLVLLPDGRVLMTTGVRSGPFGVQALTGDKAGKFDPAKAVALVTDSTNGDTGYPSSVVLEKEGRVLTFYYAVGSKTNPDWGIHCGVVEH